MLQSNSTLIKVMKHKICLFYVPVLYEMTAFIINQTRQRWWIIQASISKVNILAVLTSFRHPVLFPYKVGLKYS